METEPIEQTSSPIEWWIAEKKGNVGPFSADALRQRIGPKSWVWRPGWEDWRRAATLREADLAETGENRALFGGALAEPPPRRMYLNNSWLWGLLILPSLCNIPFALSGDALLLMLGFALAIAATILCLCMDAAALRKAGLGDKRPFWLIGLLLAPVYVIIRACRTLTGANLALTVIGALIVLALASLVRVM